MTQWPLSYEVKMVEWRDNRVLFEPERARERLKALHQAGGRWINIPGVNLLERCDFPLEEVVKRTGDEIERDGISVTSVHFAGPTYAPVDEDQSFVQDLLRRNVELFRHWRPKALVVHAGWFHGTGSRARTPDPLYFWNQFQEECKRHGLDAVRATVAANLRVMTKAAASHGIHIAIENLANFTPAGAPEDALYFKRNDLGSRQDLEYFGREIQLPNFGFCIDVGHAHLSGELPQDWIRFAGKRLFETHFHDNFGTQGFKASTDAPETCARLKKAHLDRHLSPGFGTIDWREVIKALEDIGRTAPVNFETGGWPIADPVASFRRAMEWWETCTEISRGAKH